ncbi:MAG: hypothetical protein QXD55_01940 [Candidatus Aenigmatarchaeota archaeon]
MGKKQHSDAKYYGSGLMLLLFGIIFGSFAFINLDYFLLLGSFVLIGLGSFLLLVYLFWKHSTSSSTKHSKSQNQSTK